MFKLLFDWGSAKLYNLNSPTNFLTLK